MGRPTEFTALGRRPAQQSPTDEEVEVGEEDEGRGGSRAGVVLLDQLVPLELPDAVRVVVHHLEGIAGGRRRPRWCQCNCLLLTCLQYHAYMCRIPL